MGDLAYAQDLAQEAERLPFHQRDAVILVGAAGMSLEEAASICVCEIGTIKSRVHRARARLAELMAGDPPGFDEDEAATQAAAIRTERRHGQHAALAGTPH
jgi:RNA polymerase sigma-70 factor (ECF subfamily)